MAEIYDRAAGTLARPIPPPLGSREQLRDPENVTTPLMKNTITARSAESEKIVAVMRQIEM